MAAASDFVLDEGLDEGLDKDEDVLAFHSQRHNAIPDPSPPQSSRRISIPNTPFDTIIIDGMPLKASRADLNVFFADAGDISRIQLRRLESHGILRARVKFKNQDAAELALQRDGGEFGVEKMIVSVKVDSVERWEQGCDGVVVEKNNGGAAVVVDKLPSKEAFSGKFWAAFGAAKKAAERLEEEAKKLGEELEGRFAVNEKVEGAKEALEKMDERLQVSEKVGEAARAGRETAADLDQTYGISKGVGKIVDEVGRGVEIVVREVDENLHLSEKAREAANWGLKHEGIGPAVRTVVDSVGGKELGSREGTPRKPKKYQPSGVEQNKEDTELESSVESPAEIGI